MKLCECGCGQPAPIAKQTDHRHGSIEGMPVRFISGHNFRRKGPLSCSWNGGRQIDKAGRLLIYKPDHPGAVKNYVYNSRSIAEKALGKYLTAKAIVHHVDGDPSNDKNNNLVVCENQAYHQLLHQRTRAFKACGYAHWRKCKYCKQYDDPKNLCILDNANAYHKCCVNKYQREKWFKQ